MAQLPETPSLAERCPLPWTVRMALCLYAVSHRELFRPENGLFRRERYLLPFLQETENRTVDQLTAEDLRYFLDSRRSRRPRGGPIRASTRQEYVRVLKPFFGWLHTEGYIDTNPMQGIS